MRNLLSRGSLAAFLLIGFSFVGRGAETPIVLKAARLFDGRSSALISNAIVIVQDGKILDAGANVSVPNGAQVIDLGDATLCPGFMDGHTHLTLDFSGDFNMLRLRELQLNVSEQALQATVYARQTLE